MTIILASNCYAASVTSGTITLEVVAKPALIADETNTYINLINNPFANPTTYGWLYHLNTTTTPTPAAQPKQTTGGGGGGGPVISNISTLYYDISVKTIRNKYSTGDSVTANIVIINKGHIPDRDAVMTIYLADEDGNTYDERREYFEEVPPTCPNGNYNKETDKCEYLGEEYKPDKFTLAEQLTLPPNSNPGEWRFFVEYDTEVQDLITVYDTFYVESFDINNLVIIVSILLVVFIFYRTQIINKEIKKHSYLLSKTKKVR